MNINILIYNALFYCKCFKLNKRITMMLKEKSNPWARLKYLYVLPLAAIAVTAFARPEISEKVEEISAVKVNDLAEIVETKSEENVVKELVDTTKNKVVVVGYRTEKKDSVLTSGKKKVAISVQGISGEGKPLVIIDGKEATGDDPLANISPDRIRSISVLKDKTALAAYGDKGKNGVVEVNLLVKEEYQARQISIRAINDTVTSTIKVTASEE